jgi:hypothetical protein
MYTNVFAGAAEASFDIDRYPEVGCSLILVPIILLETSVKAPIIAVSGILTSPSSLTLNNSVPALFCTNKDVVADVVPLPLIPNLAPLIEPI